MENQVKILSLLNKKETYEKELENLVYGSVEIRDKKSHKYLYVHYRNNGKLITKYIGEYSKDLHNLVLYNNIKVKELKKEIKEIDKKLQNLNYIDKDLNIKIIKNIDFAKRHLVDTIYKQAILEGITTTFADTENIINGGKVNNLTSEDVLKVINLKHAWEFILNKNVLLTNTDFNILCEINKLVEEGLYYTAGKLRDVPVSIGGTKWKPALPIESAIKEDLNKILNSSKSIVDIAIDLLLYVMKKQVFIDGNKRTAVIFSNHYLISKGKGIIVIPEDLTEEFKKILISYYEGKNISEAKKFLKEKCYINIQRETK